MSEKNITVFTLYLQRLATLTMMVATLNTSFRLLASTSWLLASACPSTVAECRSRSWCHLSASSRPVVSRAVRLRFSMNFAEGGGVEPPFIPVHSKARRVCCADRRHSLPVCYRLTIMPPYTGASVITLSSLTLNLLISSVCTMRCILFKA